MLLNLSSIIIKSSIFKVWYFFSLFSFLLVSTEVEIESFKLNFFLLILTILSGVIEVFPIILFWYFFFALFIKFSLFSSLLTGVEKVEVDKVLISSFSLIFSLVIDLLFSIFFFK